MGSKKWTEDNLRNLVIGSLSKSEVLRKMGFKGTEGGHHTTLNKYLKFYNIDVSHFTGKAWNCGERARPVNTIPPMPMENLLVENSLASLCHVKKRILKAGLMKYECAECGLTEWREKKLSLHMDHINGNSSDNRLENLRLLCPNCHSQTATYCRRKNKPKNNKAGETRTHNISTLNGTPLPIGIPPRYTSKCEACGMPAKKKYCSKNCYHKSTRAENGGERKSTRKTERPSKLILEQKVANQSFLSIGKEYGVSDNAIRKWCRYYGIEI